MPWVRLDDQFFANPKVVELGKDAKLVYLAALTYCGSQLTDGVIKAGAVRMVAAMVDADRECVADLVGAGLWEATPDGYRIHDYLLYNPSGDQVKADRANNAKRQQEWRDRNRGETGQFKEEVTSGATNTPRNVVTNALPNTAPYPSRTHPVPLPDPDPPETPPDPPARQPDTASPPSGGGKVRGVPKPTTLNRAQQERFDRWYAEYPVKQHRPDAERAWKKIDPDAEYTEVLIADVAARKLGRKWSEGYVDYPAKYLNQRVWDDDIEPVRLGRGQPRHGDNDDPVMLENGATVSAHTARIVNKYSNLKLGGE